MTRRVQALGDNRLARLHKLLLQGVVVVSLAAFGLAGCGNNNDTEPPGKHDTPDTKLQRRDKKGD
jgi:hypothetical protein